MAKLMENKRWGFTLVELIIVIAILVSLAIMMMTAFNPKAMVNKAWDAQRKKDLNSIKVAFEDYFSDTVNYPLASKVSQLNNKSNCGSKTVFAPYLNSWPCDPVTKKPYYVLTEPSGRPRWFKVFANLGNKSDKGVPEGWYDRGDTFHLGRYGINDFNYGVSSTNINWNEGFMDASCTYDELDHTRDICFSTPTGGGCKSAGGGGRGSCRGSNCYARNDCSPICKVECCGFGCY